MTGQSKNDESGPWGARGSAHAGLRRRHACGSGETRNRKPQTSSTVRRYRRVCGYQKVLVDSKSLLKSS